MDKDFLVIRPLNSVFVIIFAVLLFALVVSSLYLRKKSERIRQIVLTVVCLITLVGFFLYKLALSHDHQYDYLYGFMGGFNWWGELPLHLCNINMVLLPFAVMKKNRYLMGFCFFVGPLGALMALMMPGAGFDGYSILLPRMMGFYGTHFMVFFEGIALAAFGLYKPDYKDILPVLGLTICIAAVVFSIDVVIRLTGLNRKANYFFAMETEGNFVLDIFYKWIPYPFFCLLPCVPVLGIYMVTVTSCLKLVEIIKGNKRKK